MTNLWEQHLASGWNAFDRFRICIVVSELAGGRPATPDMIRAWVEARCKEKSDEERQRIIDAHIATLDETTEEAKQRQSNVFARVDGQLAIEGRQVKAMLREAGNICKTIVPGGRAKKGGVVVEVPGIAALKKKIAEQAFVEERYILLDRTEPDEVPEGPIHVDTARGPRTSIKRKEVCRDVEVAFTLRLMRRGIPRKTMWAVLDYAQNSGLGAERSQGFGQFRVLSIEEIK